MIRERRRFTDVMDEEIDDERKARINKYGSGDVYSLRRLRHELGTRLDGHAEADAIMQTKHEQNDGHVRRAQRDLHSGATKIENTFLNVILRSVLFTTWVCSVLWCAFAFQLPFFREKPQTVPIVANEEVEIACLAVGDPKPLVQWYK